VHCNQRCVAIFATVGCVKGSNELVRRLFVVERKKVCLRRKRRDSSDRALRR